MDKKLNSNEEHLLDLIETKDFSELTILEKELVCKLISENEFMARREVIKMAPFAFHDELPFVPSPPKMMAAKKHSLLTKSVPLYQVLLIAAMIVLLFLVVPFNQQETIQEPPKYIVQHDTIEVERLVHDTVISVQEKIVPLEKIVFINSETVVNYPKPERRLFELNPAFNAPVLNVPMILNKGNSLNDESTTAILNALPNLNL
jgi:hypothetical protein